MIYDNQTKTLYEKTNILRTVYESEIVGFTRKTLNLYKTEKYIFTYPNNTIETIKIDLKTGKSDGEIGKFIDFENNNKPKIELKNIKIEFEKSDINYELKFLIWK